MRYIKSFNESFMSDYQKLSDDFEKAKTDLINKRFDLWKSQSDTIEEIFYELDEYDNNFFKRYVSSIGGAYSNYSSFLEKLFIQHYGDKNFYNNRLKNEVFNFDCWDEKKLPEFLDSCFNVMSLFGQLHESFTLHMIIRWCDETDRPLGVSGQTPAIPSEGMDSFIKNDLRKPNQEDYKKSLIEQIVKMKNSEDVRSWVGLKFGLRALFYLQLK